MDQMHPVTSEDDIYPRYRQTPVGALLRYHNLGTGLDAHTQASLLIGMCMDNRKHLRIPDNFAYIIRAGGIYRLNASAARSSTPRALAATMARSGWSFRFSPLSNIA